MTGAPPQKHTHSPKMAIHGYPRLLSFTPFLLSNNSHTHPNYTAILDVRSLFSNIGALHFFAFIFQRFVLIPIFWGNTRVHLILTFKWMDFWGLLVITFLVIVATVLLLLPPFPFYLCPSSSLCSQTNTNFHKSQKLPVIFRQISTGNLAMVIVLRMQEWYCLQAIKPNFEV